ncbi:hypothetical protein BASA81_018177 [Batrachochytrium salamandrivorans]|nr:hypothetical protein BASA81_018177 [Batrachochytrium salamandrivorans]
MNSLFRHMISKFVLVYLDDIVVYSDNLEDHKEHVRQVLQVLKDNNLFCKAEKCHFYQTEIKYLEYIISPNGTSMDPSKISAVQDWPASEKDASDFAISGVLHQHDQTNTLRPVAFYSRQMNDAERNYDIYDKELLAVVESFKHWRHLLQGGLHPVTVLCDHKNLEYFMSTKKLTRRQARWSLELSEYTFTITHRPGKLNGRADSLSRREDYFLDGDQSNFQRVIDPDNVLDLQVAMADLDLHVLVHSTVLDKVFVQEADWPLIIADFLAGEDNVWIEEISEDWLELCKKELTNFRFRDNTFVRILNDGKSTATYMPSNDRVQVMKHYHESLAHLKYGSIIDLITRRFWWPDMKKDLKDYISRCPECQLNRSASRTHAPLPIRPVPPVALPFERWGIDFYGPMMETKSGNLMMTYGAPFEIISDRGKSFLAEGISEFERENSIRHLATTPYHPQTNGMVERMHAMLGHGLTTLVADKRDRWDEYLPQVLLAIRTRTHAVTGFSPFYLLFGTHPPDFQTMRHPQEAVSCLWTKLKEWRKTRNLLHETSKKLARHDQQQMSGQRPKLKPCESENNFDENNLGLLLQSWRYGTYWIMTPQGLRLPNAVNQADLAPWLAPVIDNVDFFYDGTNRELISGFVKDLV